MALCPAAAVSKALPTTHVLILLECLASPELSHFSTTAAAMAARRSLAALSAVAFF